MTTTLGRWTRAALGACAAALLACAPAAAEPAMWVVKDADSTVSLFGTVHVLKPDTEWRTPKIDKAFRSSGDLWIEMDEGDNPAALQGLVARLGTSPATPLSSRLNAEDKAKLQAAATVAGLPPAALEPMRPWLAAVTLTLAPLMKAGYDPAAGVDKVLQDDAEAAGRPLRTLETMEQQFRFFADLPPEVELQLLRQALDEAEEGTAMIDRMAAAWAKGDVTLLERLVVDEMRADYPAVYQVLFTRRNAAWASSIETLMKGAGTHFVAVGAGHLLGPDSVQAQLAARGIVAERR
jgi:hypothetical protein